MKTFPINRFIIVFCFIYLFLAFVGNFFLKYVSLNFLSLLIFISFYLYLYLGASLGMLLPSIKRYNFLNNAKIILNLLLLIITLTTILSWRVLIKKYSSLEFIFLHAYEIRYGTVGTSKAIIPNLYTYFNSLIYACLIISLVLLNKRKKIIYAIYAIYSFVLIIAIDFLYFGRIGILFSIFCFLGYFFYYKIRLKISHFFYLLIIVIAFTLPRLVRGGFDNFQGTMSYISPYMKINVPSGFNFVISNYIYYFSSIYAFGEYLENEKIDLTYGKRNFAPVYNIINRFILKEDRVNLIDNNVKIPFDFNVFSIAKELYVDFGYFGLVLLSLVFGIFIGNIFKSSFDSLNIFAFTWIFYTPIYNSLSFGSFFFSFIFLIIITLINNEI
jgi:oligosaccharide repeat unit polymerase